MLSFTPAGAVATPTTVQIRASRYFADRMAAGAPIPERSLSADELAENLRYFTAGLRGPRTRPCTSLVLSGEGLMDREDLLDALARAREWGIEHMTLHVGPQEVRQAAVLPVDALATRVKTVEDATQLAGIGQVHLAAVVPLVETVLGQAEELARALVAAAPSRVVLTWPFPSGGLERPPHALHASEAVSRMRPILAAGGVPAGVKGLPACLLGGADALWRSQNRWYVDAAHQKDQALLFFPHVVRFSKGDACRHCVAEPACDGAPEAWVREGLVGPFVPLET